MSSISPVGDNILLSIYSPPAEEKKSGVLIIPDDKDKRALYFVEAVGDGANANIDPCQIVMLSTDFAHPIKFNGQVFFMVQSQYIMAIIS